MKHILNSPFTLALIGAGVATGIGSCLIGLITSAPFAFFVLASGIGVLVALTYLKLRRAQVNMMKRLTDQLKTIELRAASSSSSVHSKLNTISRRTKTLEDRVGSVSSANPSTTAELSESLRQQRIILQEILLEMDLREN